MPTAPLPPLPRVARHRALICTAGTEMQRWRYLVIPATQPARVLSFADVQAFAHDVVTLGATHTAVAVCRRDRSVAVILLDPPPEVALHVAQLDTSALAVPGLDVPSLDWADQVLVVEVVPDVGRIATADLEGYRALGRMLAVRGSDLIDVVRTDGDLVLSLALAADHTDPWRQSITTPDTPAEW